MKKILIASLCFLRAISCFSQAIDDVSLVVMGSGESKEIAVQSALRSAVEQAYGVFVSANTEILNDELVKDEIATVSSGNIKSYKEIDSQRMEDNSWIVSLRAVVSTSSLASYAQSKGASCEFAGAVFGANIKLIKLNQKNTKIAFKHMKSEIMQLANKGLFDYSITLGDPVSMGKKARVRATLDVLPNATTIAAINLIYKTLKDLSITEYTYHQIDRLGGYGESMNIYDGEWQRWYFYTGGFDIEDILKNSLWKFIIKDNLGNEYISPIDYPPCRMARPGEDWQEKLYGSGNVCQKTFDNGDFCVLLRNVKCPKTTFWCNYDNKIIPKRYIIENNDSEKRKNKSKNKQEYDPVTLLLGARFPLYTIEFDLEMPFDTMIKISEFEVLPRDSKLGGEEQYLRERGDARRTYQL